VPLQNDRSELTRSLHEAILNKDIAAAEQLCISHPELGENKGPSGWTSLHFAAAVGSSVLVQQIIRNSPNILILESNSGETALHVTARFGQPEVMELILQEATKQGVVCTLLRTTDNSGWTALDFAKDPATRAILRKFIAMNPPERNSSFCR
jgi:ankyrin repeat protein